MPNINYLKKQIEKSLQEQPDIKADGINVRVVNKHVTISGVVDALSDKHRIQKVVESVEGVGPIENDLTVSTDGTIDDDHIHREIHREFQAIPQLDEASLKVTVNKGKVILEGKVTNLTERQALEQRASQVIGVKEIVNNISIANQDDIDDATIVNDISRTLTANGLTGNELEVSCNDGIVTIKGVLDIDKRNQILDLASNIPGVKHIETHPVDTTTGELNRAARVREEVKQVFNQDDTLKDLPIKIYEEEGHLILDGLVSNVNEKQKVDKVLHSMMEEYGEELIAAENKIRLQGKSGATEIIED